MNPLMNGMGNIMRMANQVSQFRRNPNGIADFLKSQGRVSEDQYNIIKQMNNPQQIGQYLMQTGMMPQQQVMQAAQSIVPQIQQQIK